MWHNIDKGHTITDKNCMSNSTCITK